MASYASNDPFYATTLHFLEWLRDRPGITISRKIEMTVLMAHNASRGTGEYTIRNLFFTMFANAPVVAVEDLAEGEELFTVSQSDVLTVQNSNLQRIKPHEFASPRHDTWKMAWVKYQRGRTTFGCCPQLSMYVVSETMFLLSDRVLSQY